MKNLILVFLFIPLIGFSQSEKPKKFKEKSVEVIFLRKVENAIKTHDADELMSYIEPEYKRIQHDEFLEGRTLQFLSELFFCTDIRFEEITNANLINIEQSKEDKNRYDVSFYISSGAKNCTCTVTMIRHAETGVLSIAGAYG